MAERRPSSMMNDTDEVPNSVDSIQHQSCWYRFRRSRSLIVFVVFVAMMLDLIMLTTLEPILPDILYQMERAEEASDHITWWPPWHPAKRHPIHKKPTIGNSSVVIPPRYTETTTRVGIVLGTKPGTEVLANLVVGLLVERYGHKWPMIFGCIANLIATLGFAFSPTFYLLIVARVVQACGSSLSVVSGLALLASVFPNEEDRARVNGIAFGGLSLGVIIGFPFGSLCYQFLGKPSPFLILAILMLLDGTLRLIIYIPDEDRIQKEHSRMPCEWAKLLMDPYIMYALGCSLFQHISLGVAVATQSAWMLEHLQAKQWEVGIVLVLSALGQLLAQFWAATCSIQVGRVVCCAIGLIITGAGFVLYPLCNMVWQVVGPETLARIGLGIILAVIAPFLGYIVDLRHHSNYGAVYGLYAASYNLGLVLGPLLGGSLLKIVGFTWLYRGTAALLFTYALLAFCVKGVEKQAAPECQHLLDDNIHVSDKGCSERYNTFAHGSVVLHRSTSLHC